MDKHINRGKYDEYKIDGVSLEILHNANQAEKERALTEFKRILEINKKRINRFNKK